MQQAMDRHDTDRSTNGTSVLVASPVYNDQCYGSYTHSLLGLQAALLQRGMGFEYAWTKSSSLITIARNLLSDWFLRHTSCTHLLFIDSDMVFRSGDVLRMLDTNLDVIAAICPRKTYNWSNVALAAREQPALPPNELANIAGSYGTFALIDPSNGIDIDKPVEVTGIGTGIMLIRREVFLRMIEAYPQSLTRSPGSGAADHTMHCFFELDRDESGTLLSEDISFCHRWRGMGGRVYGAPWFEVGHIGSHEFRGSLASIASVGGSLTVT
jgi:hypothetical protein